MLTKPSGKFLWPGLAIGILLVLGWRVLRWPQWAAIGALFLVSLTIGDEDQSSWLLYTSNFPLTRLDTPLHAEYKAEIKDWVQKTRDQLDDYHRTEMDVHDFLRSPEDHPEYPLWQKLAKESDEKLNKLYHDLSKEALASSPHLFLYIALTRLAGSANQTDFDTDRFETSYYDQKFEKQYGSKRNTPSMLRIALGIPKDEPMPPYSTVRTWINPHPDFAGARFLVAYSDAYQRAGDLIYRPRGKPSTMLESRPSFLGWWVILGTIMSLFSPWRRTLGVWAIALWGYGLAVFLLGVELHRYFTPLWALILCSSPFRSIPSIDSYCGGVPPDARSAGSGQPGPAEYKVRSRSRLEHRVLRDRGLRDLSSHVQKLIESALALTRQNLGYLYGSADPSQKGMDCSGAVYYVLRQNGIKDPPRSSAAQYEWTRKAGAFHPVTGTDLSAPEFADLKPGDLLFWNGTYDAGKDLPATHAMFYLGKAKSDGLPLMVGSSDGRRYRDKRRDGVSVFDFRLPKPGSKSRFIGYARIPGLQ